MSDRWMPASAYDAIVAERDALADENKRIAGLLFIARSERDAFAARLAEAEALLSEARKDALQLMDTMQREDFGTYSIVPGIADGIARIDAFLSADSASHRENDSHE